MPMAVGARQAGIAPDFAVQSQRQPPEGGMRIKVVTREKISLVFNGGSSPLKTIFLYKNSETGGMIYVSEL